MEAKSEPSNNEVTQEKLNNLKAKSNIIFLTNAKKITFMNKNDNEYKCEYCGKKFFSKYNKKRHIDEVHLEISRYFNFKNNKTHTNNENFFEKNKEIENNIIQENPIIFFIGSKRKPSIDLNEITAPNKKEKISSEIKEKKDDNILIEVDNIVTKKENNILVEEKNEEFLIIPKKLNTKKNISEIIIQNLYYILNNNPYYAISNFFMFKELVIGHGK